MAYSSLPFPGNTNLENLRVIAEDTTIYIAPPNNGLGKTGSAGTWTGLTWGSDSAGDGTLAKPYATLKKAWQKAQEYIITGNARLTIQFQKGIYGYTYDTTDRTTNPFPENLYHPQGDSIIIQGDPAGIKQRYLYRVSGYGWELSRWSYYGHTGTVNLWRAQHFGGDTAASYPLGSGNTAHGFTFEDEKGYACIANAAMDSENGYKDAWNGVGSGYGSGKYYTSDSYGHAWGRAHFNHGLSYEEALGIIGICRIEDARSSGYSLGLQFKNANLDGRIFTYPIINQGTVRPGLGIGLSYGGIDSNYPEPQYSQPNGFYGPTYGVAVDGTTVSPAWEAVSTTVFGNNSAAVNITYPSRNSGEVHITDDPHILTSYPVVIKVYTGDTVSSTDNKPIPLYLDSAKVGGIRNIMFVNGDIDAPSRTANSRGQTLGPANGLNTLRYINEDSRASSNECLVLRNRSETRIRHIGMIGWGINKGHCVVVQDGSTLMLDPCIDVEDYYRASYFSSSGGGNARAELGRLNNTPMLMSSHGGGIDISGSSFVDFSQSTLKKTAYLSKSSVNTPATLWLQNIQSSGITVKGSRAVLGPTHIRSMTLLPGLYIFRLNLPVLAGMTVYGGSTGCFYHPTVFGSGKGVTYTSVIGYKRTSAGRTPFMRVMKMTNEGATYASGNWWGLGNITWSGGLTPVYNQEVSYVGMKLGDAGFDSDRAVRAFLDSGTGNTLEFFAYHDTTEGSTAAKQYLAIGKNSIVLSTEGGVTYIGTTAGYGVTAAFRDIVNGKNRQSCVDLYEFTNNSYDYIDCSYGGDIEIRGNTTLGGTRSYVGMYIYFGSKVTICPPANLSVRDCSHSGILCEWDSSLQSTIGDEGSIIIKHPIGFGVAAGADYNSNYGYGMHARNGGGFGNWGSMVVIGCPLSASAVGNEAGQFNGFFTTDSSAVGVDSSLGVDSSNAPLRFATGSENALSSSGYQGVVAGWDGGAAKESGLVNGMVAQLSSRAVLHGIGAINHIWNTAQGQGSNTPRIMTRGDWGSGSAGQWLYNSPMGATMWWIRTESGWMSSVNNTSATVNTAYKAPLVWGSGYDSVIATPQTAGAFTANPPGYSGPVIKIANSGGHDNELIFRT